MDFVYKFTTQNAKYIPESQQLTEEQKKIIGKVSVEISEIETISSSEKKYIGKASGTLEGLPVFKFNYDETTGLTTSIALQNDDTIPFVISGSFGIIGPLTGSGSSPYYQISGSVSNIINGNAVLLSDGEANLTPEGKQECYESYADYIKRLFYQKYLTVYGKKLYQEVIGIETEGISNFVHQNEFKEPTITEEKPKNDELIENKKPDFPPDKIYTFNVEKYGYLINPDIGTFSIILPDIPTETILGDIFPDDSDENIDLDEEYNETGFSGADKDVTLLNMAMEGADGDLSLEQKKNSQFPDELENENLAPLRVVRGKQVGNNETERANNTFAKPYGLKLTSPSDANSSAYKKLLKVVNFSTEMFYSGSIIGNKQKLINSSSGTVENVFMSELVYNGSLTWKNSSGVIYKTGRGSTWKSDHFKLDLKVHQDALPGLERAYQMIQQEYGLDKMWDLGLNTSSGTFVPRFKRGSSSSLSIHTWGVAIDICAGSNGLTTKCPKALFCKPEYERFIEIMESNGWYSLGRSWGQDYMHFQAVE